MTMRAFMTSSVVEFRDGLSITIASGFPSDITYRYPTIVRHIGLKIAQLNLHPSQPSEPNVRYLYRRIKVHTQLL